MDEDDVVRTGMEIVLRPVTDIASDVLGLAGGDWLHEHRERNRARLREKTRKILDGEHVRPQDASPSILLPLLTAAQDESTDELLDLWAKLLAAALDPAKASSVRRNFVEAVKQMDAFDVGIFDRLGRGSMSAAVGRPNNVLVSLDHLNKLGCVSNGTEGVSTFLSSSFVILTAFGQELFDLLHP